LAASRKPYTPSANGRCFWCRDLVAPDLRYCDDGCRDDHANAERLAKIRGKR